jgi:hypothetical protein
VLITWFLLVIISCGRSVAVRRSAWWFWCD